jgi:hypothetical protein
MYIAIELRETRKRYKPLKEYTFFEKLIAGLLYKMTGKKYRKRV